MESYSIGLQQEWDVLRIKILILLKLQLSKGENAYSTHHPAWSNLPNPVAVGGTGEKRGTQAKAAKVGFF